MKSSPPSTAPATRNSLRPSAGLTSALVALALALSACSDGDDDAPSEANFEFGPTELERAITGTYSGTLTPTGGDPMAFTLTIGRAPTDSTTGSSMAQSLDPAALSLDLRPLCGSVSRDLTSMDVAANARRPLCYTSYSTSMSVVGTASSEAFASVDLAVSGSFSAEGLHLPAIWQRFELDLPDGSRLHGYADRDRPFSGDWGTAADEVRGLFELTKSAE